MTEADVCEFLDIVESLTIGIWLDGGWAVDAWLGGQTRPHADIDIVIEARDLATLVEALRTRGYADVPRDDTRPWNFADVLALCDRFAIDIPAMYRQPLDM